MTKTSPASPLSPQEAILFPPALCERCTLLEAKIPQIFEWFDRQENFRYIFDVDRCYSLANEMSLPIHTLSKENLQDILAPGSPNFVDPLHVPHVAPYCHVPALVAVAKNGKHILLDGIHRAKACQVRGRPFRFFLLPWDMVNTTRMLWVEKLLRDKNMDMDQLVAAALKEQGRAPSGEPA